MMRPTLVALAATLAMTLPIMAQGYDRSAGTEQAWNDYAQTYGRVGQVAANGRCRGMSYGTGARSCGTATGGPVGGLTNRN